MGRTLKKYTRQVRPNLSVRKRYILFQQQVYLYCKTTEALFCIFNFKILYL